MKKKIALVQIVTLLSFMVFSGSVFSDDTIVNTNAKVDPVTILLENGFSEETIHVLPREIIDEFAQKLIDDPASVETSTFVMELDNLTEIEDFLAASDEELAEMNADPVAVDIVRQDLEEISQKTVEQLAEEKNISITEAKYFKKAIEKGKERKRNKQNNNNNKKKHKNSVNASGTISSSTLTFTQSISNQTIPSQPNYRIAMSYNWNSVYIVAVSSDKIIAKWNGGFIGTAPSGYASYYDCGMAWGSFYQSQNMSRYISNNVLTYEFPQSLTRTLTLRAKNRTGYAIFTLYKTSTQGQNATLTTYYNHIWDQTPSKVATLRN